MSAGTIIFLMLVILAIVLAIVERRYALANEARMLRDGAVEVAPLVFRLMVPVYALIFPLAVIEHLVAPRRPSTGAVVAMGLLFLAAKGLKLWAVIHLRDGWTMKVIVPERLRVVTTGPYRYMRHPNYIAVMGEILTLPLAGGAVLTAAGGGVLFLLILVARVRTEEAALLRKQEYAAAMGGKGRFLPRGRA